VFDPTLLTTFVTVTKAGSFTEAGRRLGLRQSTVSQHVRRLEEAASRRLFVRDTHSVALTADGEAMLGLAQGILDANDRARRYFGCVLAPRKISCKAACRKCCASSPAFIAPSISN
jgi:DNA-binding transcriptional LysR family regulator